MDVLTIKGLVKSFGSKDVLRGLELSVPERSVFGFVGKNGAGKTTTMKAVLGFIKADEGEIYVAGERVAFGQTPTNKYVGYLPDVPAFYSFMNAREYLKLSGECLGLSPEEISKRTEELLSLVGLAEEKGRIKGYSRGMKQRLGIAQALIGKPKLLICDEPTSALDPIGRKQILDILLSVREQTTVIFSTHILSDVERICTDVAIINNGKIEMQGPVSELKNMSRDKGFTIELSDGDELPEIRAQFPDCREIDGGLEFDGGSDEMYRVIDFIKANGLSLRKLERKEASLESLFMEVVEK